MVLIAIYDLYTGIIDIIIHPHWSKWSYGLKSGFIHPHTCVRAWV